MTQEISQEEFQRRMDTLPAEIRQAAQRDVVLHAALHQAALRETWDRDTVLTKCVLALIDNKRQIVEMFSTHMRQCGGPVLVHMEQLGLVPRCDQHPDRPRLATLQIAGGQPMRHLCRECVQGALLATAAPISDYRSVPPRAEEILAHWSARGGWWQRIQDCAPAAEIVRLTREGTVTIIGTHGGIGWETIGLGAVDAPGWKWRPCTHDGTPCPWPGLATSEGAKR